MILYLDSSALVKRYVYEAGSDEVNAWIASAQALITGLVTRAEIAAALTRLSRMNILVQDEAQRVLGIFRLEWENLVRLPISEITVQRAELLACRHGLRGYDAIHLAAALLWRETTTRPVHLVTFDRQLWQAAQDEGLVVLPERP